MRVGRVAVLALTAALVLSGAHAKVKWLVRDYPVVMIAWARTALVTLFLFTIHVRAPGGRLFRPVAWRLQTVRGAAAVLGNSMFLLGERGDRMGGHAADRPWWRGADGQAIEPTSNAGFAEREISSRRSCKERPRVFVLG